MKKIGGPFKAEVKNKAKKNIILDDAIKEADILNKDEIKYDSIVKLGDKHFQLRKAKLADKKMDRDLWLLKSESNRIMAIKAKKRTIKIKPKLSITTKNSNDDLWEGPIENMESSIIKGTKQVITNSLDEAKQKALTLGEKYDSIVKDNKKYKIRQTKIIDKNDKKTLWIRKSAKNNLKFK